MCLQLLCAGHSPLCTPDCILNLAVSHNVLRHSWLQLQCMYILYTKYNFVVAYSKFSLLAHANSQLEVFRLCFPFNSQTDLAGLEQAAPLASTDLLLMKRWSQWRLQSHSQGLAPR